MKECEKVDLSNCTWKALPDMKEGRTFFNPCLFNDCVYVCGENSNLVEAFSPQTECFLPLQVELPEDSSCCLFVYNHLLVVHSTQYISKFSAGQAKQLVLHSQVSSPPSNKYSNCPPVVDSALCFICQDGDVYSISLETGTSLKLT